MPPYDIIIERMIAVVEIIHIEMNAGQVERLHSILIAVQYPFYFRCVKQVDVLRPVRGETGNPRIVDAILSDGGRADGPRLDIADLAGYETGDLFGRHIRKYVVRDGCDQRVDICDTFR